MDNEREELEEGAIILDEDEHAEDIAMRIQEAVEAEVAEETAANEELVAMLRAQLEAQRLMEPAVEVVAAETPQPATNGFQVGEGITFTGPFLQTGAITADHITIDGPTIGNRHGWAPINRERYKFDWNKINSVQDIMIVLKMTLGDYTFNRHQVEKFHAQHLMRRDDI